MTLLRTGSKLAHLSTVAAIALAGFAGNALAQSAVRVDFELGDGVGSIAEPGLASSGYLLLSFDDSTPLMTDGTGAFTVAAFATAELHLDGAHPAETEIQQIGSALQLGSIYSLSLELNNAWSTGGTNYTEGFQISFSTDTGAAPLLTTPSEFGLFALQQVGAGAMGQVFLTRSAAAEMGSTEGNYSYAAVITGVTAVPEPASALMLLQGLGAVAAAGLLRKKVNAASH